MNVYVGTGVMICVVMTVAQLWKKVGLNEDLTPLLNLLIAIILTLIWQTDLEFFSRLQQGLLIGLSASGIYAVYQCFKND